MDMNLSKSSPVILMSINLSLQCGTQRATDEFGNGLFPRLGSGENLFTFVKGKTNFALAAPFGGLGLPGFLGLGWGISQLLKNGGSGCRFWRYCRG
jgi:hypothetical protein